MKFGDTLRFTDSDTGKEYTAEFMDHMQLTNDYNYDCDVEVDKVTYSLYYHIEDEVLYCTVESYDLHSDEVQAVLGDIVMDDEKKYRDSLKKLGKTDDEIDEEVNKARDEVLTHFPQLSNDKEFPWSIENYDMIMLEEFLQMTIGYFREESNDTKEYDWNYVPSLKAHVLTGFDKTDEKDQECITILRKHIKLYGCKIDDDLLVRTSE